MSPRLSSRPRRGIALITALVMLLVISILAVAAARLAINSKKTASNQRDRDLAMQAAQAALEDAEADIQGASAATSRSTLFSGISLNVIPFVTGCNTGTSAAAPYQGLCDAIVDGTPNWLTVDFTQTDGNARTVGYGTFTGRKFPTAASGLLPAALPRYIIEPVQDTSAGGNGSTVVFRITAVGFGASTATRVMLQEYFQKGE